ncbi:hypothetical protein B0I72DRAFT_88194, partial [Yarrowia lipolytica]
ICSAPKGHFLGQIPHPIHSVSEMKAILESGVTSIHSLPVRTTGHDFLHSCRHFLGLHLSTLTIAIRVFLSPSLTSFLFLGGIMMLEFRSSVVRGVPNFCTL